MKKSDFKKEKLNSKQNGAQNDEAGSDEERSVKEEESNQVKDEIKQEHQEVRVIDKFRVPKSGTRTRTLSWTRTTSGSTCSTMV